MKRVVCAWLALALLCVCACTSRIEGGDPSDWTVAEARLQLDAVDWNPNHAELGMVGAVLEDGDDVIVWSTSGVSLMAGGAVTASDASVSDVHFAARVPAPDGFGAWAVGVDGAGQLYRVRARSRLDAISDRYGLAGERVQALAGLQAPTVAFALGKQLALADGAKVTRYAVACQRGLAADAKQLVALDQAGVARVFDAETHALSELPLRGARTAVYAEPGRLLLATDDAVYEQRDTGLERVYDAASRLHGLVRSGDRVWLADGSRLCALAGRTLLCSAEHAIADAASVIASDSGDVWVIADGSLSRHGVPATGDEADWRAEVFSVYARVCSACHAPGGSSGVDLSSYSAWNERRAKVYERVIVQKSMPPDRTLSDTDRAAIEAWAMP